MSAFNFVESLKQTEPENPEHIERIRYLNNRAQIIECLKWIENNIR